MKLKLTKRPDGLWITGFPTGFEDHGPYDDKAEANEDRAGLERTLEHWDAEKQDWVGFRRGNKL